MRRNFYETFRINILLIEEENSINDFIENLPGTGRIGLWGRSMGAATAVLYAHKDPRISCVVMDSPFADFSLLAKQLCLQKIKLPNFISFNDEAPLNIEFISITSEVSKFAKLREVTLRQLENIALMAVT